MHLCIKVLVIYAILRVTQLVKKCVLGYTGIPKIIRSMRENGSPKQKFETDEDRTYFIVERCIQPDFIEDKAQDKARDMEEKIVTCLKEEDMSKKEIAAKYY